MKVYLIISSQLFTCHVSFAGAASSCWRRRGFCMKAREGAVWYGQIAPEPQKHPAITAFEWRTVRKLNGALTERGNTLIILIQIPSLVATPPDFCLSYRNLTAIKYVPCTPSGTIPLPHTSRRRGPGSEATCWADQRLELRSAAKEAWQT